MGIKKIGEMLYTILRLMLLVVGISFLLLL